jgi:heat shock protein HslJ
MNVTAQRSTNSWMRPGLIAVVLVIGVALIRLLQEPAAPPAPPVPAATATAAPVEAAAPPAVALDGSAWLLTAWNVELDLSGLTIDLAFADGRISGTSAVNVYNADYTAEADGSFRVGAVAMTKMAGPEPAMQAEAMYQALLQATAGWQIDGDTLTLLDADGQAALTFTRQ